MVVHNFVLSCADYRILGHIQDYVGRDEYYLFTLVGGSLGALSRPEWMKVFREHLEFEMERNPITTLWIFDHMDCKYYQALTKRLDTNEEHIQYISMLTNELQQIYPNLIIKPYLIDRIQATPCLDCVASNI